MPLLNLQFQWPPLLFIEKKVVGKTEAVAYWNFGNHWFYYWNVFALFIWYFFTHTASPVIKNGLFYIYQSEIYIYIYS